MPLVDIFKRASRLVLNLQNSNSTTNYEEGEIVFCKNNVCVHPPTILRQETEIIHHPGYLTISCQSTNKYCNQSNSTNDTTLVLTWIPNATLRKCPSSVEKLSARKSHENGIKSSPKLESVPSKTCNRKNSLHSITSLDSQESSLSNSQISPGPGKKIISPDFCDSVSVESNHEMFLGSPHLINDQYNLQVVMTDNDEICKIIMKKNNCSPSDSQDASLQNPLCAKQLVVSDSQPDLNNCSQNELNQQASGNTCVQKVTAEAPNQSVVSPENELISSLQAVNVNELSISMAKSKSGLEENVFNPTDNQLECEISDVCLNLEESSISTKNDIGLISKDSSLNSGPTSCKKSQSEPDSSESTERRNSKSGLDELKPETRSLCSSIEKRFDSAKNEATSILNDESTNCKESESKPDNSDIQFNKDCANSIKNSPSKFSSLSNSLSSDFTNATSIDSVSNDSVEKEAEALKTSSDCSDSNSCDSSVPMWTYSSEYLNRRRYIPESTTASPATIRQIQRSCQKFSVDLGEMRSLRLFFSNGDTSSGQLVVASRESQYKILHFHHGGLDRLAKILQEWNRLTNFEPSNKSHLEDVLYRHFMICRPEVNENDLHPEEGKVPMLTEELWLNLLNEIGQIEDPLFLRKSVFFNGLPPQLRSTVWPFLLQIYSYQSTYADREAISKIRKLEYQEIIRRRSKLTGINKENFTRNVQYVIEKDVVRTDRNNPFYAGDTNPNLETMTNILLNYAVYDSSLGYLQGMSDLLAPLLAEILDESESFWCFCGLMQRRLFVCTPTDADMEKNLRYLRELIRIMVPSFYSHLLKHEDAMELLFCHRWILLCFKREFPEAIVFQIWEACWSNYLIDYFHLFVCLAIVAAYSPDVIAQDLRTDEMLLHFSSLAMYMDGTLILKKARWLLYKFRQLLVIPCSLAMLCQFSGPGMWDNSHTPSVECLDNPKYCPDTPCPYRGSFAVDG